MPRKTYQLGDLTFTSKDAIKKHARSICQRLNAGDPLEGSDEAFVRDLLEWHPSASQKIGCGIDHFEVHIPKPWNTKGLLLVRTDGTSTDFSYNVCLNPALANQHVKFKAACRRAIWGQVSSYKTQYFAGSDFAKCVLTGDLIRWDEAHVDHYPVPFADLLDRYVQETGLDADSVVMIDSYDHNAIDRIADPLLEKDWADWHKANASFRVVRADENIRLGRHAEVSA
jgi:hypothetical protein